MKIKKQKESKERDIEQEIKEAVEKEEETKPTDEIKEEIKYLTKEEEKNIPAKEEKKEETSSEYMEKGLIENQEFYIKDEEDIDKIKETINELKQTESGMSSVDDSELYFVEPETKKLKIRKMPRTILDKLKQKKILLEYYKEL